MAEGSKYQEALDYIYSFVDYSLTRNLRYSPEKFNLSRMERFFEIIGNPQKNFGIIHVAGTKGKGSICAMITSILSHGGYKTGFYSSPHMIDFAERIRIGEKLISHKELISYVDYLKPYIAQVDRITTFEITTALAFKYFSDLKVEFAVIEVGLGGRFDATNVVEPLVSVISTISFDHTRILGNTLSKIAFEKAGIIKKGVPVVVSRQKKTALQTIENIAQQKNSPLINAKEKYKILSGIKSLDFQDFKITWNSHQSENIRLPLIGDHQLENSRTAFAVIEELRKQGINISDRAVIDGFRRVDWPGRFEIIQKEPMVIIDGAHNPESFRNLRNTIRDYLPNKDIIFVFGVSEDKNVRSMLNIIKPVIKHLIITRSVHPRALETIKIQDIAESLGISSFCVDEVEQAKEKAESLSAHEGVIIAAGSIFVAGAFREMYL
jgi:dihydrofolate synthase/folylpolyglutamate synthase